MNSIIQDFEGCYICGAPTTEVHHIFFGAKNRKISDISGFCVALCPYHHRGPKSPHMDRKIDLELKKIAQATYEKDHTREEFIKLIGRSYL